MQTIKKDTMYISEDEKDILAHTEGLDTPPKDKQEYEDWLNWNAESVVDMNLDGMFCENQTQFGVTWKIEDPTEEDKNDSEYKSVLEE